MHSPLFGRINHSPILWTCHGRKREARSAAKMMNSWGGHPFAVLIGQQRSEATSYFETAMTVPSENNHFLSYLEGGGGVGQAHMYIFQFSVLGSEDNQILSIKILSLIFFSLHLQIFDGNCDHFTPVVNILEHGIKARYVRFYPVTYNYVCMRVEVYGCDAWRPWP